MKKLFEKTFVRSSKKPKGQTLLKGLTENRKTKGVLSFCLSLKKNKRSTSSSTINIGRVVALVETFLGGSIAISSVNILSKTAKMLLDSFAKTLNCQIVCFFRLIKIILLKLT